MEMGTVIVIAIVAGLCIAFSGKNVFKNDGGGSGGSSGGGSSSSGGSSNTTTGGDA